jgi:hypothetical protein
MPRKLSALLLTLALLGPATGFTQILSPSDVVSQVLGLAPQLVAFAGSDTNFRSLVQGLNLGTPVTLVTVTADGLTQTVTFTPAGNMSAADIARTLEAARQQLITRGIGAPTAQQIGTALVGGSLPTPAGTVQVTPVITTATPGGIRPSASTGASAPAPRFGSTNPPSNLSIDIQPTTTTSTTGTTTTTTGSTSTTGTTTGTTSTGTGNTGTPAAPGVVFSGPTPIFTTTPQAATTNPNGAPPPAVQMQGHK